MKLEFPVISGWYILVAKEDYKNVTNKENNDAVIGGNLQKL